MASFTLWLIRHGQSVFNKQNVIQGHMDVPLSELGLEQARLTGTHLQNQNFSHVYSSDLIRANQTAKEIMKRNHHFSGSIVHDSRIRERKFGDCEGKNGKYLRELAAASRKSVKEFCPPGGESLKDLRQRAVSFFNELCETMGKYISTKNKADADTYSTTDPVAISSVEGLHSKDSRHLLYSDASCSKSSEEDFGYNVLIVSHGGFLKMLVDHLFQSFGCTYQGAENPYCITPNTAISKFVIHLADGYPSKITCLCLHSKQHLICNVDKINYASSKNIDQDAL